MADKAPPAPYRPGEPAPMHVSNGRDLYGDDKVVMVVLAVRVREGTRPSQAADTVMEMLQEEFAVLGEPDGLVGIDLICQHD